MYQYFIIGNLFSYIKYKIEVMVLSSVLNVTIDIYTIVFIDISRIYKVLSCNTRVFDIGSRRRSFEFIGF